MGRGSGARARAQIERERPIPLIVWLSTERMTFLAELDEQGMVVDAAPIARRFVGQPFGNLRRWLRRQGGYRGLVLP